MKRFQYQIFLIASNKLTVQQCGTYAKHIRVYMFLLLVCSPRTAHHFWKYSHVLNLILHVQAIVTKKEA